MIRCRVSCNILCKKNNIQDGHDSIHTLTNNTGTVTDTYSYSAFGELQNQTGATVNHYLYTGQQFDDASGLYSLRARYYAPGVGRFLSQDTYGINFSNPIELNRYGYTANNPVNASDPSGYEGLLGYGGININSARNIQAVAMIGAAVKSGFIIALVMLPGGILVGELLGLDDMVRDLVRDLPQEKSLLQQAMEKEWADYQALKARLAPTPSPESDPSPEPQITPGPPIPPQPTPNTEQEYIYRKGPDKVRSVRLYRPEDWKTGFSFSIFPFPPPEGSVTYRVEKLRANGYVVNFDENQPSLDLPFFGGGFYRGVRITLPVGHVTVYFNNESYWTKWYEVEQPNFGKSNTSPQTDAFYALSEK